MQTPPNNGQDGAGRLSTVRARPGETAGAGASPMEQVLYEVKKTIVGQDVLLERLLVALLARGHVMLEGVPGLAKTATIKALSEAVGGTFGRVQFTPDLLPSDLVGSRVYNVRTGELTTEVGPVFVNPVTPGNDALPTHRRSRHLGAK